MLTSTKCPDSSSCVTPVYPLPSTVPVEKETSRYNANFPSSIHRISLHPVSLSSDKMELKIMPNQFCQIPIAICYFDLIDDCCSLNPDSILAPHCRLPSVDEASVLPHIPMIGEKPLLPSLYLEMPKDHRLRLPALCRLLVADGLPLFTAALLISRAWTWIASFLRLRGSITSGVLVSEASRVYELES